MRSSRILVEEGHTEVLLASRTSPSRGLHFPESFSRTSPAVQEDDPMSDSSPVASPLMTTSPSPLLFSRRMVEFDDSVERSPSPNQRSKANVMRLENILNDPEYERPQSYGYRSRSLCASPAQSEMSVSPSVSVPQQARSVSPAERVVKRKKVKMHKCAECQKEFPRPSGLRTHMNMHTKEKPFPCTYPGCTRTFSVVSNAKRHMRTHGVGVHADAASADASVGAAGAQAVPYIVGFEKPVVLESLEPDVKEPLKLRWVGNCPGATNGSVNSSTALSGAASMVDGSINGSTNGSANGAGSPPRSGSAVSSRARSLSGAGSGRGGARVSSPLDHWDDPLNGAPSISKVGKSDLHLFSRAADDDQRRETMGGPPSPESYEDYHEKERGGNGTSSRVRGRRMVESEGSLRVPAVLR